MNLSIPWPLLQLISKICQKENIIIYWGFKSLRSLEILCIGFRETYELIVSVPLLPMFHSLKRVIVEKRWWKSYWWGLKKESYLLFPRQNNKPSVMEWHTHTQCRDTVFGIVSHIFIYGSFWGSKLAVNQLQYWISLGERESMLLRHVWILIPANWLLFSSAVWVSQELSG